mmetsp:Transcript_39651/g.92802  ORF Transcript_39651/g.92802 Transcript_39651/m.92802 type:complete len:205 (-) Transcript_39651:399-1013(-)
MVVANDSNRSNRVNTRIVGYALTAPNVCVTDTMKLVETIVQEYKDQGIDVSSVCADGEFAKYWRSQDGRPLTYEQLKKYVREKLKALNVLALSNTLQKHLAESGLPGAAAIKFGADRYIKQLFHPKNKDTVIQDHLPLEYGNLVTELDALISEHSATSDKKKLRTASKARVVRELLISQAIEEGATMTFVRGCFPSRLTLRSRR